MLTPRPRFRDRLLALVPFGLFSRKPRHFRDMLKILWDNRDNLRHAWRVLSKGVCDGCALGVQGFHDWTMPGIHLCMTRLNLLRLNTVGPVADDRLTSAALFAKTRTLDNAALRGLGRLAHPMVREKGATAFRRISWDEANARIARKIRSSEGKRLAFFLTSRAITNEVYYVAQKVARRLGTNSVDNAARLCHSPSTGAMKDALGAAASTCSYRDWYGTDLIVFFGANPANDQPVTTKYLEQAKRLGTRVAVVNPFREPGLERYWVPSSFPSAVFGTRLMDYWIPVAQGGDIALLYGVLKTIFSNGWENREFLSARTEGVDDLRRAALEMPWEAITKGAGLTRDQIDRFARLFRDAKNAVLVWSMGITQHAFGGDAVRMILNLGLVMGYVGREKNGLVPIRGHSGVQGGAEMGAYSTAFPGGKAINAENAARLSALYGFPVPDSPGLTSTEMVEAAGRGELDLLYCVGGNFLRTLPDPDRVARAMERVPLRVHQDIVLTDQMFLDAAEETILLPAQTRYEQDGGGTETTTERRVIYSPQIPREVGEARAEWRILRDLAVAVDPRNDALLGCRTGSEIRQEIARVVPFYDGIAKLERPGENFVYGGTRLFDDGRFATPGGRARLRPVALPPPRVAPGALCVSTRRGKQFNTLIYAETDPLTGAPRDAIFLNPEDAATAAVKNGDRVALVNETGRYEGRAWLAPIARGSAQVHWPEGNVILPAGIVDPVGGVPDYNAMAKLEPCGRDAARA